LKKKKKTLLLCDYFSVVVEQFIINSLYYYIFLVRITYSLLLLLYNTYIEVLFVLKFLVAGTTFFSECINASKSNTWTNSIDTNSIKSRL